MNSAPSVNIELAQIITQELFKLEDMINKTARKVFGNEDHSKMISEILFCISDDDLNKDDSSSQGFGNEYIDTHCKIYCALAALSLSLAKNLAATATMEGVSDYFFEAMGLITNGFYCIGASEEHREGILDKSKFASSMAAIRHAPSRAKKEQAIQYYKNNHKNFKNKDDAAEYISGHVVASAFSTVRGYLRGI